MNYKKLIFLVLGVVLSWGMVTAVHASPGADIQRGLINTASSHHNLYFVAVNGRSNAKGSRKSPWDLQTALGKLSLVRPGDTLTLEGGTYAGHFTSYLNGTQARPITVTTMFKGRVVIKSSDTTTVASLVINGSWTTYKGLVIYGTDPQSLINTASGNRFIHVTINNPQIKSGVFNVKGQIKTISDRGGINKTILGNVVSGSKI